MSGQQRGFMSHWKKRCSENFCNSLHYILSTFDLKISEWLHPTLQVVIKAGNKIKAHLSNTRIFRQFFHETGDFERLL